jgi:hypothetical protein
MNSIRTRSLLAVLALALVVPLAACGGSDGGGETSGKDSASGEDTATTAAPDDAGDDDADAAAAEEMISDLATGDGDNTMGLELETRVSAMEAALDFVDYSIDGSTLTLVFDEGTVDNDGAIACIGAGAVMGDDETLVLEYPDGTTTC